MLECFSCDPENNPMMYVTIDWGIVLQSEANLQD